jgi:DNA-binding transcriptional ArsR family regulator
MSRSMSRKRPNPAQYRRARHKRPAHAELFAALGHKARLALVARLCAGPPESISQLTSGSRLTRQAVTKHLRVLERAGIVHSARAGRESLFALDPEPMQQMQDYLGRVSREWDRTLARLKAFLEKN